MSDQRLTPAEAARVLSEGGKCQQMKNLSHPHWANSHAPVTWLDMDTDTAVYLDSRYLYRRKEVGPTLPDVLEQLARNCESIQDGDTGKDSTFIPGLYTRFFSDYMYDAAKQLRAKDVPLRVTRHQLGEAWCSVDIASREDDAALAVLHSLGIAVDVED